MQKHFFGSEPLSQRSNHYLGKAVCSVIQAAIEERKGSDDDFHFPENEQNLQYASSINGMRPDCYKNMEVLCVTIGDTDGLDIFNDKKHMLRMAEAQLVIRSIGFLPQARTTRLRDLGIIFAHPFSG